MSDGQLPAEFAQRIKAEDGMAITADVWNEAHDYHRRILQTHLQHGHSHGILTGLNVLARGPKNNEDKAVVVMPGVATDSNGNIIIVPNQTTLTLEALKPEGGWVYLTLAYGESVAQPDNSPGRTGLNVKHIRHEYKPAWALTEPSAPTIELARVRLAPREPTVASKPELKIRNASRPSRPGLNEIDLRFRGTVSIQPNVVAALGVATIGNVKNPAHQRACISGLRVLAQRFGQSGKVYLGIDENVPLNASMNDYALIYLIVNEQPQMDKVDKAVCEALYNYVMVRGGTLFVECAPANRNQVGDLLTFFQQMAMSAPAEAGHTLLSKPHFFAFLPTGYVTNEPPKMYVFRDSNKVEKGIILSTGGYGMVWSGLQQSGPASRETIRAAHEIGENLIAYALKKDRLIWPEWVENYADSGD